MTGSQQPTGHQRRPARSGLRFSSFAGTLPALVAAVLLLQTFALRAASQTQVITSRPRLFLRESDTAALRERCRTVPEVRSAYRLVRELAYSDAMQKNLWVAPDELSAVLVAHVVENRDPKLLDRARRYMKFFSRADGDSWTRPRMLKALSHAYDWLRHDLTVQEREGCAARIRKLAEQMRQGYRHSDYNNHVYLERGPIVYAGLALAGDGVADDFVRSALAEGELLLKKHFLPTINQLGGDGRGGWHESMSYFHFFTYVVGDASNAYGSFEDSRPAQEKPSFVRRFIYLKPSVFVIDDQVRAPRWARPVRWLLHSRRKPEITGRRIRIVEGDGQLVCETLWPKSVAVEVVPQTGGRRPRTDYRMEAAPEGEPEIIRFLHVLHARPLHAGDSKSLSQNMLGAGLPTPPKGPTEGLPQPYAASSEAIAKLEEAGGELHLQIVAEGKAFDLTLPAGRIAACRIAIADSAGQTVLARRLLPAGVLPFGAEGMRLLERWDSAYRRSSRPSWDVGRPSSDLKKAVEQGDIRPCRALELGCGAGTNAIYLAKQGFDVTAIDIAPTALNQATERAREAGVHVRWLLADVLAPPDLEPFDFLYDRGCYHGVRGQNAAGYVETVRRCAKPGALLLLLAGNANDPQPRSGPPRVKEEELRGDFSAAFEFEWLRETRFDSPNADASGALAWSALLRRKGDQ